VISWLHPEAYTFPPVSMALRDPEGLLAAGGDLTPARIISAYKRGIFPWYNPGEPILWWSPDPRCVIYPNQVHISKSLKKTLRKNDFRVTFDLNFDEVIRSCSGPRQKANGTWISEEIIDAYTRLHRMGIAHSVEVWRDKQLIGGLYGMALGRIFFGESMFSKETDASKIAFSFLCHQLNKWGFALIDCQVHNPHLESMGAIEIPRDTFIDILVEHTEAAPHQGWMFEIDTQHILGS